MNQLFPRSGRSTWIFVLLTCFFMTTHALSQEDDRENLLREIEDLKSRMEKMEERVGPERDGRSMDVFYKRGLCFETRDGDIKARIQGKINIDSVLMSSDRSLRDYIESTGDDLDDGVEFRRARLTLSGELYERYIYKASYDFSQGQSEFRDVYVGMKHLPFDATFRVGHFKEPFSLENQTAANGLRMIERSLVTLLTPRRNTGIGVHGTYMEQRGTWGAGTFYNTDSFGDGGGDGDLSGTARVTHLPWWQGEEELFHLGVSYSLRGEDDIRYRAIPESIVAPIFIDTDGFSDQDPHLIELDRGDLYGVEAAYVWDAFSTQGEYVAMHVDGRNGDDPKFSAFYWAGSYFITGEHRRYDRTRGRFGSVTPHDDFLNGQGGPGAWEIAARYSMIDLRGEGVTFGKKLTDKTVGVNWYLNPMVYVACNYIHAHLSSEGTAKLLVFRFGLEF